ncbi:hypothetical protein [Kribbella solani]|uniref:Uncharacterized protein n=1 Tax=Kribbella solani TaxID=236067 RepID=A0A841DY99_9ACTN|nr:hypothetical protein [Kribbella solani]MBB5983632.1 hypothetical protein [Kribbella solani]
MKPVDEMDEMLRRAGARWRADQRGPAEPDVAFVVSGGRKRRRWVSALAAASVAVVAAGVLAVAPGDVPAANGVAASVDQGEAGPRNRPGMAGTDRAPSADGPGAGVGGVANEGLLVGVGDLVRVSGRVIGVPGKVPVYCAPLAVPVVGYAKGQEPAPSCPAGYAVALYGADLDRIAGVTTVKGVRIGDATFTGIWRGRSIDVREQSAMVAPKPEALPELPCAAPEGGWRPEPSNVSSPAVNAFLAAHAGQAYGPVIYYPYGTSRGAPVVTMVGVAHGDLGAFRDAFEKVYSGNLCVAPVLMSRADDERVSNALASTVNAKGLGIYASSGAGMTGGPASVSMIAYTEQVKSALTPIGLGLIRVEPQVVPVR